MVFAFYYFVVFVVHVDIFGADLGLQQRVVLEYVLFEILDEFLHGFGEEDWVGVLGGYIQTGLADKAFLVVEGAADYRDGLRILHPYFGHSEALRLLLDGGYVESLVLRSILLYIEINQILV